MVGTSAFRNQKDLNGSSNSPNGLMIIFFVCRLVGILVIGHHHVSLGKCTSDMMVAIVMDLTDMVVCWMVGGLGGNQTDANRCLSLLVWDIRP